MRTRLLPVLAVLAVVLAACGGNAEPDADETTTAAAPPTAAATSAAPSSEPVAPSASTTTAPADTGSTPPSACAGDLPLLNEGVLTVATGEPAFEPWMVDDDPTNGQGFESALVYALAEQMGLSADQITWTRTGFAEAVAPGDKDWDVNIQQYSITPERDEVVDFSDGYYTVQQALVADDESDVASATSLTDLADARLGAAIGTTSLDYAEQVIAPDEQVLAFDDNAAAKAAFNADQVDALVFDLPTAYYITAVEIPEATIVGTLPASDDAEELGMMFAEGSELVPCVNEALAALDGDGTLAALQEEWLNQGGDIPDVSN